MQIRVDHKKLEGAAAKIDTYVSVHRSNMSAIGADLDRLNAHWQGPDYTQVKREWDEMNAYDSVSMQMIRAMESYASFLRLASKKYKEAQINAVNRANSLTRW